METRAQDRLHMYYIWRLGLMTDFICITYLDYGSSPISSVLHMESMNRAMFGSGEHLCQFKVLAVWSISLVCGWGLWLRSAGCLIYLVGYPACHTQVWPVKSHLFYKAWLSLLIIHTPAQCNIHQHFLLLTLVTHGKLGCNFGIMLHSQVVRPNPNPERCRL